MSEVFSCCKCPCNGSGECFACRSGDHVTMTKEDWSEALSGMSEEQIERSFDRWE